MSEIPMFDNFYEDENVHIFVYNKPGKQKSKAFSINTKDFRKEREEFE